MIICYSINLSEKEEWKMLKKTGRVLLQTCLCGLVSDCTTTGGTLEENKSNVSKAYLSSTAQPSPIANALLNITTAVLAVYVVGKIKHGPEIIQTISNHRLRKIEIENRLPSTVSVIRHDE